MPSKEGEKQLCFEFWWWQLYEGLRCVQANNSTADALAQMGPDVEGSHG